MQYTRQSQRYFELLREWNRVNQLLGNGSRLTPSELALLAAIGKHMDRPKGIKSSDVSRELKVTTAAVSKMLRVLEKKGLIVRSGDGEDRRIVYVRLTDRGNDAFLESMGEREDLLETVFQRMGREDVETLLSLWENFNRLMANEHKKKDARKGKGKEKMNTVYVESKGIPFAAPDLLEKLGMPRDHAFGESLAAIIAKAAPLAKPKAFYMEMKIEKRSSDSVTVGGQTFHSAELARRLTGADIVYPYLCSCGRELADYADGCDDIMERYALDMIMEGCRKDVLAKLIETLAAALGENGRTFAVQPGSLPDWALTEQKKLFSLFDDAAAQIGVTLSDSCIMDPVKSVSGFRFPAPGLAGPQEDDLAGE